MAEELSVGIEQSLKFTTAIPKEVLHIEWEIKSLKALVDIKESWKSATLDFEAGSSVGAPCKWRFFLLPQEESADKIGVFLKLLDSPADLVKAFARYETTIKRLDGTVYKKKSTDVINMKGIPDWGWGTLESTAVLLSPTNNISADGGITIYLRLEVYSPSTVNNYHGKPKDSEIARLQSLSTLLVCEDLLNAFTSGVSADVTIETKDKKTFNAHKIVLEARSPVFLSMFENEMKEAATGKVQIKDLNSDTMTVMLKYIYSGQLDSAWIDSAEEIIYAAEKYQLPALKSYCDQMLITGVTNENALELLRVARFHNLTKAVKDISAFIKTNISQVLEVC